MGASRIQGITVEIGGDTTKLTAALKGVNGEIRTTQSQVLATYKYAVELFAYLCQQFGLDPMADDVVISHSEGCRRGIARGS